MESKALGSLEGELLACIRPEIEALEKKIVSRCIQAIESKSKDEMDDLEMLEHVTRQMTEESLKNSLEDTRKRVDELEGQNKRLKKLNSELKKHGEELATFVLKCSYKMKSELTQ